MELASDPHAICVSPGRFREHLEVIRARYNPIALADLLAALSDGRVPRLSVVVTFDDGYADNLLEAKPLLERYEVPATVFVTTGYVGLGREFWWDELERCLLRPGTLPETLALTIEGEADSWDLGDGTDYSEEEFQRNRGWNWRAHTYPSVRQRLFRELFQRLQPLQHEDRCSALQTLSSWADEGPLARATHQVLTPDELLHLADSDLIEIGAHSVTHPLLSELPPAERRKEISDSKTFLEDVLGTRVDSFAYPYGVIADTVDAVRQAGFQAACATSNGIVFPDQDVYQLPRAYVGDWDGDEFARRIRTIG